MIRDLPKIELHLPHRGSRSLPPFIRGLAKEKSVDLSGIFAGDGSYAYRDFRDFLKVYEAATSVTHHAGRLRPPHAGGARLKARPPAWSTPRRSSAPDFCGGRDVGAWREYLAAILERPPTSAIRARRRQSSCAASSPASRHFGPEKAKETALCAAETAGDWVVGFGIAGDEAKGRPKDFAWAFDAAREAGLRLTAHAGEWAGPESVRRRRSTTSA